MTATAAEAVDYDELPATAILFNLVCLIASSALLSLAIAKLVMDYASEAMWHSSSSSSSSDSDSDGDSDSDSDGVAEISS